MTTTTPFLLRHLAGEKTGRLPVWMMRQAGRYLPEYRKVREKHSFWDMVRLPEVAAEVTLQPMRRMPLDAAILFSDILTLPWGLGVPIEMREGIGPVTLQPLTSAKEFERFTAFDAETHTPFVGEALTKIRAALEPERALIGFAGAPWTVACYLVEGRGKRSFEGIVRWAQRDPNDCAEALRLLGVATEKYLQHQLRHGADLLQLFDTWVSEMPLPFFRDRYVPTLNAIFRPLRKAGRKVVYFPRHAHHLLGALSAVEADVIGCDSLAPLGHFAEKTHGKFALQGNLDPRLLLTDEATVRKATRELVAEARKLSVPVVANLGHGIFPEVAPEVAAAFVTEARSPWT